MKRRKLLLGILFAISVVILTACGEKDDLSSSITHEHTYEMIKKDDAICGFDGQIIYECKECGNSYTEIIPKKEHVLTYVPAKKASFTESGNKEYWYCENCNTYFKDNGRGIYWNNEWFQPKIEQYVTNDDGTLEYNENGDIIKSTFDRVENNVMLHFTCNKIYDDDFNLIEDETIALNDYGDEIRYERRKYIDVIGLPRCLTYIERRLNINYFTGEKTQEIWTLGEDRKHNLIMSFVYGNKQESLILEYEKTENGYLNRNKYIFEKYISYDDANEIQTISEKNMIYDENYDKIITKIEKTYDKSYNVINWFEYNYDDNITTIICKNSDGSINYKNVCTKIYDKKGNYIENEVKTYDSKNEIIGIENSYKDGLTYYKMKKISYSLDIENYQCEEIDAIEITNYEYDEAGNYCFNSEIKDLNGNFLSESTGIEYINNNGDLLYNWCNLYRRRVYAENGEYKGFITNIYTYDSNYKEVKNIKTKETLEGEFVEEEVYEYDEAGNLKYMKIFFNDSGYKEKLIDEIFNGLKHHTTILYEDGIVIDISKAFFVNGEWYHYYWYNGHKVKTTIYSDEWDVLYHMVYEGNDDGEIIEGTGKKYDSSWNIIE